MTKHLFNYCAIDWYENELKENNLEEIVAIQEATARLIANRVSFKLKFDRINEMVTDLHRILEREAVAQ